MGGGTFAINTQCDILGKHVDVDFKKEGKVTVSIVKDSFTSSHQECDRDTYCDEEGHCHSIPSCHTVTDTSYTYLTGDFVKN